MSAAGRLLLHAQLAFWGCVLILRASALAGLWLVRRSGAGVQPALEAA